MSEIIPAILTKDKEILKKRLELMKGVSDWIQIDIMDGIFVDNLSVDISDLPHISKKFNIEIHLMVENPSDYLKKAEEAGIDRFIFHIESSDDPAFILNEAENKGFEVGIGINPETSSYEIEEYLEKIDEVLLLSVVPGFAGQEIQYEVLEKAAEIKEMNKEVKIGMDGGIDLYNIEKVAETGVDYIVSGTGIFETKYPISTIKKMREKIK